MNIGEVCTREVVFVDRAGSLQQAANLMREHHVGALLVVGDSAEGQHVVGIVTDRDLVVEGIARGLDIAHTEIGRFTDGKFAAVPASASIDEAITTMKTRGVRRLLVSSEGGQLHGIVSLDDVLDALAHEMSELAHAVRSGIERETAERAPLPAAQPRAVRISPYSIA